MTNEIFDFFEKGQKALEPYGQLSELGMEAVEKFVNLEADIASDFIDLTVDQLRVLGTAEDVAGYTQEQGRLFSEYAGRAQKRAAAWLETVTDVQKAMFNVAKSGYEEAAAAAAKVAEPAKATRKKAA